jgi:hypothetical protein
MPTADASLTPSLSLYRWTYRGLYAPTGTRTFYSQASKGMQVGSTAVFIGTRWCNSKYIHWLPLRRERPRDRVRGKKKKKKSLIACRGLGRVVGPLLAARALPLRCAASTVLSSTLLAI